MLNGKMYESDFEQSVVELIQNAGWEYTFGENLHRLITEPLLLDDLNTYLRTRYNDKGLDENDYETIIANLKNISGVNDYDALRNTFKLYHDGYDFRFSDITKQPFHLEYIDFDTPSNNIFRVVNQFEIRQGNQTRIPDVMLFINGIPVCIIELKNPTNVNTTIRDAHTQITVRYRRDISSLMKYCPIACISDGSNTRLGTITSPYEFFYAWKKITGDKNEDIKGVEELKSLINGALTPNRILEIIKDFIYFPDKTVKNSKEVCIICRYPQFFAAKKLKDSVIKHLNNNGGDGKGGIYFGATGCGKTYTMLFLSKLLTHCPEITTPTILLLVDREDLEEQASKLFCISKEYLEDGAIRVFDNRTDLKDELSTRNSGGVFITTIQKFTSSTGLLSDRSNIICLSDEAHRTQNNIGSTFKVNKKSTDTQEAGVFTSEGFAKYLRDALPNATYVGFTGTPTDNSMAVFGDIVDEYTMQQSQLDGITVSINYDPRLARVFTDEKGKSKLQEIENYYKLCAEEGASPADIEKSKKAMSSMNAILKDPDRLNVIAEDIIKDYEIRCANKPNVVQKAMIACSDRYIAYDLYKIIARLRPECIKPVKTLDETKIDKSELNKLNEVPFINVIATESANDPKEMYDLLGNSQYRSNMADEFKNDKSNYHIAIDVDMWITGFDVPSLTILYNDKPLQKHTLIQTISRVNRVYPNKDCGVIVDYLGIRENMKQALKMYGNDIKNDTDLDMSLCTLRNELQILKDETCRLDFTPYFNGKSLEQLEFLQTASEYILNNSVEEKGKVSFKSRFKGHVRILKSAYDICNPAGILSIEETSWSQCFMGISSFLRKITDTVHDIESMNRDVEKMVQEALDCSGIENILNSTGAKDIFNSKFLDEINNVKMPNTKFQLLVNLLNKAIKEYKHKDQLKGIEFSKKLNDIIDKYNTRDDLTFANEVASDVVNAVSDVIDKKIKDLLNLMDEIKEEYENPIPFDVKAFYNILTFLRDKHKFEYPDDKCLELAEKIKNLITDSSIYSDWLESNNLKGKLESDLTELLYDNGYPPQWNKDVFDKVLDQVQNFKKYENIE